MLIPAASRFLPLLAVVVAAFTATANADDLGEASTLLRAGKHQQAMERVNKVLAGKPADPKARFLKGLIYTEQGNSRAAIETFRKLTEDYPELPEPYNNLAVIYASQGEYDKARVALEQSIRTHPSYATAYENLGDVYARLASQAYDKALKLDSSNAGAQNKLALVRDLVGDSPREAAPAPKPSAQPVAEKPAPKPAAQPVAEKPVPTPAPAKPAPEKVAATKPPAEKPAAAKPDPDAVLQAVKAWAEAWSRQDVEAYLAAYDKDFRTPRGEPRADWERQRRDRLTAPKSISVTIEDASVAPAEGGRVNVRFRQEYRSDVFSGNATKTLTMTRAADGRWRILQEQVSN